MDEVPQVRVVWTPESERPQDDEQHDDGFEHELSFEKRVPRTTGAFPRLFCRDGRDDELGTGEAGETGGRLRLARC